MRKIRLIQFRRGQQFHSLLEVSSNLVPTINYHIIYFVQRKNNKKRVNLKKKIKKVNGYFKDIDLKKKLEIFYRKKKTIKVV